MSDGIVIKRNGKPTIKIDGCFVLIVLAMICFTLIAIFGSCC